MNNFSNLFPENLYHSYVVLGDPEITSSKLLEFLETDGYVKKNSPDVLFRTFDSFTMEDGKQIKEWHSQLKITDGKKICIIGTKFINREAERTLLKVIEEPAENTHFFLVIPNSLSLLDTIYSRTHTIDTKNINNDFGDLALNFLSLSPKERIDLITKFISKNKDENGSGGLRFKAISFINEIEKIIFDEFKLDKNNKKLINSLEELQKNRNYLSDQGASVKMILEYLSLVL